MTPAQWCCLNNLNVFFKYFDVMKLEHGLDSRKNEWRRTTGILHSQRLSVLVQSLTNELNPILVHCFQKEKRSIFCNFLWKNSPVSSLIWKFQCLRFYLKHMEWWMIRNIWLTFMAVTVGESVHASLIECYQVVRLPSIWSRFCTLCQTHHGQLDCVLACIWLICVYGENMLQILMPVCTVNRWHL